MIERYEDPSIREIFSDKEKYRRWVLVEKQVLLAQIEAGVVISDLSAQYLIEGLVPELVDDEFCQWVQDLESETRHDVVAFLRAVHMATGINTRWLHFGVTSSNIVDCGLALGLQQAGGVIQDSLNQADKVLNEMILRWSGFPMIARTHGQVAKATNWGVRLHKWGALLENARLAVKEATEVAQVGSIGGPVGDYQSPVTAEVESKALRSMGLRVDEGSCQAVGRWVVAKWASGMAFATSCMEAIATDLRVAYMVGDVYLAAPDGYVGSSSMPHKVNPIGLEKISGMARLARGMAGAEQEAMVSWLERDLTASSLDRVVVPDMCHLVVHAANTLRDQLSLVNVVEMGPIMDSAPRSWENQVESVLDGFDRWT